MGLYWGYMYIYIYIYTIFMYTSGYIGDRSGYIEVYWGYEVILGYNMWLYKGLGSESSILGRPLLQCRVHDSSGFKSSWGSRVWLGTGSV